MRSGLSHTINHQQAQFVFTWLEGSERNPCRSGTAAPRRGRGQECDRPADAEIWRRQVQRVVLRAYIRGVELDLVAGDSKLCASADGEGSGLGLSVVHGITKSHGGAITVETEVGKGTRFNLFFPALQVEISTPKHVAENETRGQGERILFVDE